MSKLLILLSISFSTSLFAEFYSDTENTPKGSTITLTWSSNANSCTASGAWSGSKSASGTEGVTLAQEGWNMFSINCGDILEYVWVWGTAEITITSNSEGTSTSSVPSSSSETTTPSNSSLTNTPSISDDITDTNSDSTSTPASDNESLGISGSFDFGNFFSELLGNQNETSNTTQNEITLDQSAEQSSAVSSVSTSNESETTSVDDTSNAEDLSDSSLNNTTTSTPDSDNSPTSQDSTINSETQTLNTSFTINENLLKLLVEQNSYVTLNWSSPEEATDCSASGVWSGAKSTSGTESVYMDEIGENIFYLHCSSPSEFSYQFVVIDVVEEIIFEASTDNLVTPSQEVVLPNTTIFFYNKTSYSIPENQTKAFTADIGNEGLTVSLGFGSTGPGEQDSFTTAPTWSLSDTADNQFFQINNLGEVTFKEPPNFEDPKDLDLDNIYEVVIGVGTGINLMATMEVQVIVSDSKEILLTNNLDSPVEIYENKQNVLRVSAATALLNNDLEIQYSIPDSEDGSLFSINTSNGDLSFIEAPDFENPLDSDKNNSYLLKVSAIAGSERAEELLTINISDVNLQILNSDTHLITENQTNVFDVEASAKINSSPSDDLSQSIVYNLSGPDANLFNVSPSGYLTFKTAADYESPQDTDKNNLYLVSIDITAGGESISKDFSIYITDVNELDFSLSSNSVPENQKGGIIGQLSVVGNNSTNVSWSLIGNEASLFEIAESGSTFNLKVKEGEATNYENKTSFNFSIVLTEANQQIAKPTTIYVQDVNESVVISGLQSSITVQEGQTEVLTLFASDEEGSILSYSLSGADASELSISLTGVITFINTPSYDSKNAYSVTVNVSDGTLTTSQDVLINIRSPQSSNQAPSFINLPSTLSLDENQTLITSVLVNDPEGDLISYSLTGSDANLMSISSSGVLSFNTAPDFEPPNEIAYDSNSNKFMQQNPNETATTSYEVVVHINDGVNYVQKDITININNVNEPPTYHFSQNEGGNHSRYFKPVNSHILEQPENSSRVKKFYPYGCNNDSKYCMKYYSYFHDPEWKPISLSLGGEDASFFTLEENHYISSSSGEETRRWYVYPTGVESYNYEDPQDPGADNDYKFSVSASDGVNSTTIDLTIKITNYLECDLNINSNPQTYEIAENTTSTGDARLARCLEQEAEPSRIYTYMGFDWEIYSPPPEIAINPCDREGAGAWGENDNEFFTITDVNNNGYWEFNFKSPPDYEDPKDFDSNNTYRICHNSMVIIDGTMSGGAHGEQTNILVTDVND